MNDIITDRWADAFRHTRPNTNDYRANRGNQDRRIAHQARHVERRLSLQERWNLAINRWRMERSAA
jgi:hypothetical protein